MLPSGLLSSPWLPAAFLAAGAFVSLRMEGFCQPRCAGLRRGWPSLAMHLGLFLLAWSVCLAACRRPIFALLAVLAGQLLVVQVNNAKYRALREPFIFSDFGIFSQAIKHPRLYFPFLGLGRLVLLVCVIAAAVMIGWQLEPSMAHFFSWSGAAALAGSVLLVAGASFSPSPTLDPERDMAAQGLFASVARCWLLEKTEAPPRATTLPPIRTRKSESPDVVVIQSESFFDARRLFGGVRREVLTNFDSACQDASLSGRLEVPAWGANTMRPEFAFLTGLPPHSLGIHRFNPYRRVTRRPIRALPAVLQEAGYRTTCIHPHPARFFRRDRAFPYLGFERFLDMRQFRGAKKAGPYISDEAVTDKLIEELQATNEPSLFFVITMENHGPLHLEKPLPGEADELFSKARPSGCQDLTIYLRHLRNADEQLGRLRNELKQRSRPTILCFYGEHLPSMPGVYSALGMPDGRTDYFLELPLSAERLREDKKVEQLAEVILRALAV